MRNFTRRLLTEWRKLDLPFAAGNVVVAVSGGADSVSLLLALDELRKLKKLDARVVVAHFNHNLRGDASGADESFVQSLAQRFGFELALGAAENVAAEKGNLEQTARAARYRFLTETAENLAARHVLTAHTLNDQAETFLFNLLRGSGIEGLGGMKPRRSLEFRVSSLKSQVPSRKSEDNPESAEDSEADEQCKIQNPKSKIELIRPLLSWARREDTEDFCRLNRIEFRYDAMNEDLKFNRVRIRKVLLPLLKDFNPNIVETLAQTARLLREDAEHLADASRQSFTGKEATKDEGRRTKDGIALKDLRDVFPSMRRAILREWLKDNRGDLRGLQFAHVEAIERLIFSRKSGKVVELPQGASVVKQNGKLTFVEKNVESASA